MGNPRIVLAGTGSGSGKTWFTCALLRACTLRKMKISAFKCGPDYIDPMYHREVLGVPSRNLDLFFTGEEETRALFLADQETELSVIEGVMGLYDGLGGISEEASTYHLAKALSAPILLIVHCHGKGRSVAAEISGFLNMDRERLIKGVILNRVSDAFFGSIKSVVEELTGIPVMGYLPERSQWHMESRHLGLKLPGEKESLLENVTAAAQQLEKTVDLDGILRLAVEEDEKHPLTAKKFPWLAPKAERMEKVKVGVARDEAFCFYYRDNLRLLENAGAELVPFSPLHDRKLPEGICGILLGGGYPELWAKELAENIELREQIRSVLLSGLPSLAECGGFMYLHDQIRLENGEEYPMVGVISGKSYYTGKSVRFGYAEFSSEELGLRIRGHEFHYFDSEQCGQSCIARKPISGREWQCMHAGEDHLWGFGHLYYPSAPEFAERFVGLCRSFGTSH